MTRRLLRSAQAATDILDIWDYIADDNLNAADRVVAQIVAAERRLVTFPEIGRQRPDISAGLRSWTVGAYLIPYRATPDTVDIVRVVHGARDLGDLFADD